MSILALKNKLYPSSNSEHLIVITEDDGITLAWQAHGVEEGKESKKDRIKLALDKELELLDILLIHLRERLDK